jgi:hypothetical protein
MGYSVLLERTLSAFLWGWMLDWLAPFFHRASYCGGNFLSACVWEADVQDCFIVVCCHLHGPVYRFEHIWLDEFSLTEYPNARAVAVEKVAVL